jgi:polyferredoxin
MVHGVLLFAVLMTAGMIYTFFTGRGSLLGIPTYTVAEFYGFFIGAGFAGVIGTGFYPLMGNRVWCRFGCPLAAYLGIVQRFKSRFRITTNGGQCISCGNCSTYCEMGIDVRWYAQRGQNIIRASCVGCGVCASVCPRGVLKLENGQEEGRFGQPIHIGNESVKVNP